MLRKSIAALFALALCATGAAAAKDLNFDQLDGNVTKAALASNNLKISVPRSVPANYRRGRNGSWTIMCCIPPLTPRNRRRFQKKSLQACSERK